MCGRYYVEPEKGLPEMERIRAYIRQRFGDEALDEVKSGEVLPGDLAAVLLPAPPVSPAPAGTLVSAVSTPSSHGSAGTESETETRGSFIAMPMRWGFPSFDKKLLINARAESAAEKPTFREAVRQRRCVIPATGFVEYSHDSRGRAIDKYRFEMPEGSMLYMAGLVLPHEGEWRFVILTTAANASVVAIHHRMPLVLPKSLIKPYLQNAEEAKRLLGAEVPLLQHLPV